jgi:hypothetical protein
MPYGEWIRVLQEAAAPSAPQSDETVLANYPVALGAAQNERTNDLLREFALMQAGGGREITLPALARLESLAKEMVAKYGPQLVEPALELQRAIEAREATTELRYPLIPVTRAIILDYAGLMEQIDAYCRDDALITLAPSAEVYALRRWTVEEFVRQYDGLEPRPWPPA